ncbi:chymotrypsinogen A-like [Stegodyphus dumicola]|uniref:chymotrypsinogen A-like n=1 Tax=Stegodyphus dumicola TaxID=202533 RepID=UPI0015B24925|nr:chymotrypsinogen A-like [Stegodyphus dumicola]
MFSSAKRAFKMIQSWKCFFLLVIFFLSTAEGLDTECVSGNILELDLIKNPVGNLYSPGYKQSKSYPNEVECGFNLTSSEGTYIRLKFNVLNITQNPTCSDDHIIVNYMDSNGTLATAGFYCGKLNVPDMISPFNAVQIKFKSGYFGTSVGFNITYRVVSSRSLCLPGQFQCRNRKCLPNNSSLCNGDDECGDGTDEENCDYAAATFETCGTPEVQPVIGKHPLDRIVGGRQAVRGSWPWQVDMQYAVILPNGHFCGGTLLNSQWFVTAAHCFQQLRFPYQIRVHLGNHHKYKPDPYEIVRYVKDYFIYGVAKEDFLRDAEFSMSHDLALAKLNAPVAPNPHVQPACLPQQNEELRIGEKCWSTGWGLTRGSSSEHALKQAEHPILNEKKCYNDFQEFENKTMICAGRLDPLHGLCHGDSGGPLVCQKSGHWYVYGATSFITRVNYIDGLCGMADTPAVFNKVSAKIDWIEDTMQANT